MTPTLATLLTALVVAVFCAGDELRAQQHQPGYRHRGYRWPPVVVAAVLGACIGAAFAGVMLHWLRVPV